MKTIFALLFLGLLTTGYAHARGDDGESKMVTQLGKHRTYSEADVYKVWCEKKSPTCSYGDRQVARAELPLLMPKATWGYCRKEFCYGDSHMSDVIGLNPEYFIYPLRKARPIEAMAAKETP